MWCRFCYGDCHRKQTAFCLGSKSPWSDSSRQGISTHIEHPNHLSNAINCSVVLRQLPFCNPDKKTSSLGSISRQTIAILRFWVVKYKKEKCKVSQDPNWPNVEIRPELQHKSSHIFNIPWDTFLITHTVKTDFWRRLRYYLSRKVEVDHSCC